MIAAAIARAAEGSEPTDFVGEVLGVYGDIFALLGPFAGPIGMLFVVMGLMLAIRGLWDMNRGYAGGGASRMLGGFVFFGLGFALPAFAGGKGDSKTVADKPTPKPTETPVPDISDKGTGGGNPLSPDTVEVIVLVGGIVLAVAVVIGVIAAVYFGIRHQRRKHAAALAAAEQARAEEQARLGRVWDEAVARHDHVRDEMMRHASDIDLVLSMPVINDQGDPKTAAFVDALAKAVDLSHDVRPSSADAVEAYASATRAAERAWGAAWRNADIVRLSKFTPEERTTIKQVIKFMQRAEHETTPEARAAYYRKAMKDLGNLIEIPRPAAEAIEQRVAGILANPAAVTAAEPVGVEGLASGRDVLGGWATKVRERILVR